MASRLTLERWLFVAVLLVVPAAHVTAAQGGGGPQVVTVGVWRAAGVMALVPAALLWVLHRNWRREYVRAWLAVWLCLAAPLFVFSVGADVLDLDNPAGREVRLAVGRLIAAVAGLTWLGGTAVLALSAEWVRGPVTWPRRTWGLAVAAAIVVVTGTVSIGLIVLVAALWIGGLVTLTAGAYRFFRLARRESFFGALLIGGALTIIPVHAAVSRLLSASAVTAPERLEISIMVYAVLALGMHLVVFEDVTYELRRQNAALADAQAELKTKAVTDPLTGCYNRRFFDEVATHELERHKRHALPLSLLFVDCDRFKTINDECGHETGDRVLQVIAGVLAAHVRQSDYVFRWGGDEFLVMLTCDETSAARKAHDMRQAFANDAMMVRLPRGVALSIGWLAVPASATDLAVCVREVDARMYAQKARRVAHSA